MEDEIQYETPYGIFWKLFDHFLLKKHLTFILERNLFKALAEKHQNNHQKTGILSKKKHNIWNGSHLHTLLKIDCRDCQSHFKAKNSILKSLDKI
jgi:hypothetical protein